MPAQTEKSTIKTTGPWGKGTNRAPRGAAWYVGVKSALDFVLGIVLLIVTAPFMGAAMIAIKLTSPGPVIYRQTRVGRGGRTFTIFKVRTMIHNCESRTGPQWAREHDPRITPVGSFLRRTHLDELPQLWNVLR
ncbi:MAG: sugar transferase, partial [Singulisphaera sp.]